MKTVLITKPGEIAVTDTPKPVVKENEALLKIRYCGVCGADVASYTGNQPFTTYPRIQALFIQLVEKIIDKAS